MVARLRGHDGVRGAGVYLKWAFAARRSAMPGPVLDESGAELICRLKVHLSLLLSTEPPPTVVIPASCSARFQHDGRDPSRSRFFVGLSIVRGDTTVRIKTATWTDPVLRRDDGPGVRPAVSQNSVVFARCILGTRHAREGRQPRMTLWVCPTSRTAGTMTPWGVSDAAHCQHETNAPKTINRCRKSVRGCGSGHGRGSCGTPP